MKPFICTDQSPSPTWHFSRCKLAVRICQSCKLVCSGWSGWSV